MRYNPHVAQPSTPNTQSPSGRSIQSLTGGVAVTGFQGWPPDFCPEGFFMSGITAERARELFAYDPHTGALTWKKSGKGRRLDLRAGQIRKDGYGKTKVDYQEVYNHRLIWLMVTGEWPQHHIDHINCDTSDNRWENLRDVPLPTNNENIRRPKSKNQSGYLGVDWRQDLRKFRAVITVKGRQINLGFFTDPSDAHAAYLTAKRKLHTGCTL